MPLDDITLIEEGDTFQTLFNTTNNIIGRLNETDIAYIRPDGGLTITTPDSGGGVTLSAIINNTGFIVGATSAPPIGTVGYFTGVTFVMSGITSGNMNLIEKPIGFVTEHFYTAGVTTGYKLSTSGRMASTVYDIDTVYYLGDTVLTSIPPSAVGKIIRPVVFGMGNTYGAVILNQKGVLISESDDFSKSSSRNIAEVPGAGLSVGTVVFYNALNAGWSLSNANNFQTAEVFGVVESISGLTANVISGGSVKIPSSVLHQIGDSPEGSEGGEDIWFLSAVTAGHMQNAAPITPGEIVKPIYYSAPHEFAGITYSGIFVNYIGYKVLEGGGSVSDSLMASDTSSFTSLGHVYSSINSIGDVASAYATDEYATLLGQILTVVGENRTISLPNDLIVYVPTNRYTQLQDVVGYTNGFAATVTTTIALTTDSLVYLGWGTGTGNIAGKVLVGGSTSSIILFYKNSGIYPNTTNIKIHNGATNLTAYPQGAISIRLPNLKDPYSPYSIMRIEPGSSIPSNILDSSIQFLLEQITNINANIDNIAIKAKIPRV